MARMAKTPKVMSGMACPYCEGIRALLPSAKACPDCNHLMVGDTCDACYGNGERGDMVSKYWEISQKRQQDTEEE